MSWIRTKTTPVISFLSVVLLSFFLSVFGFSLPTFAAEDYHGHHTSGSSSGLFCDNDGVRHCFDYNYLIIFNHSYDVPIYSSPGSSSGSFFGTCFTSMAYCIIDFAKVSDNSSFYFSRGSLSTEYDFILTSQVPVPPFSVPSESLAIDENGTYDVTNYASVDVNVVCPECSGGGGGGGLSSEDSERIIKAIYAIPAVLLVIYFFYCIYRMFIRSTGGRR